VRIRITMLLTAIVMGGSVAVAQTPPTATEAFNLRTKCKAMADEKADSLEIHPMTTADGAALGLSAASVEALNKNLDATREVLLSSHSSKYDAKNNRCYVEIFEQKKYGKHKENEIQMRQIYDAKTDDLLAFAQIQNDKKVGMVFDPEHRRTADESFGWDDANAYIDEMMLDKRR